MLFTKIIKPNTQLRKYSTLCSEHMNMFSTTFKIGFMVILSSFISTQTILTKIDNDNKNLSKQILNIYKN